jgi:hypothetical protein
MLIGVVVGGQSSAGQSSAAQGDAAHGDAWAHRSGFDALAPEFAEARAE